MAEPRRQRVDEQIALATRRVRPDHPFQEGFAVVCPVLMCFVFVSGQQACNSAGLTAATRSSAFTDTGKEANEKRCDVVTAEMSDCP